MERTYLNVCVLPPRPFFLHPPPSTSFPSATSLLPICPSLLLRASQDIVTPPTCYEPHPDKEHTWQFTTVYLNDSLKGMERKDKLFYG